MINSADVRDSKIRRLRELRDNRIKNEVREALDRLERIATLSEDDDNNNNDINGINIRNNGKNGDGGVGGERREEISTSQGDHTHNLLRLFLEAASVRCMLVEILYTLEKIWGRHVPSSPLIFGSFIASFCGGRGGGRR